LRMEGWRVFSRTTQACLGYDCVENGGNTPGSLVGGWRDVGGGMVRPGWVGVCTGTVQGFLVEICRRKLGADVNHRTSDRSTSRGGNAIKNQH